MATVTKKLSLDVSRKNLLPNIIAKQYDTDSRFLTVTLLDEGQAIKAEAASTVIISFRRADGQAKSFSGKANEDGTVTVPLANWALELDDIVECDISVYSGEAKLSTTTFQLEVQPAANGSGDISEDENYDILEQLIVEVKDATEEAKTAKREADEARDRANEAAEGAETARDDTVKATAGANTAANRATSAADAANAAKLNADAATKKANDAAAAASSATDSALEAEAAATSAAAAAREAAAAVGDEIDGIVIIDNDSSTKYLGKFRISSGHPALEITKLQ